MEPNLTLEYLPKAVNQLNIKLEKIERLLLQRDNQYANEQPDELFSIQKASEFLNLSIPTIYSKVSKGELPVMKRSKRLYFSRMELIDYLKKGRKKSNAEIEIEANTYISNHKK